MEISIALDIIHTNLVVLVGLRVAAEVDCDVILIYGHRVDHYRQLQDQEAAQQGDAGV